MQNQIESFVHKYVFLQNAKLYHILSTQKAHTLLFHAVMKHILKAYIT